MNIIKDKGLDIFVSYHPAVIKLKKEAKVLYKEEKSKGISLMQCQEKIAKKHGFNNWHHFFQLIKKHYEKGAEAMPYIITKEIETNDHFLLGHDINLNHYKWQDNYYMKTHIAIFGENIFKTYDLFLAIQAINKGNTIFFLNGNNDQNTIESLKSSAINCGREKDLKIIDSFSKHKIKNDFNLHIEPNILAEIFNSCLEKIESDYTKAKTLLFLNMLMKDLKEKANNNNSELSLEVIRDNILLNKYIDVDDEIIINIKNMINNLLDSKMFSNNINAIKIDQILEKDKSIYIINTENQLQNNFITSIIKKCASIKINTPSDYLKIGNTSLYNIFFREVSAMTGLGVLASHLRALGVSMVLSYSSLNKMRNLLGKEKFEVILANTMTKIVESNNEEDIKFFKINDEKNIKSIEKNSNYIWIMKKGDLSQISFSHI